MTGRSFTKDELAAIHAKSNGHKGVPSTAFLQKINHNISKPNLRVENVKMFKNKSKPHSVVYFSDGKQIKVKETSDPYKAASNARMFKRNL